MSLEWACSISACRSLAKHKHASDFVYRFPKRIARPSCVICYIWSYCFLRISPCRTSSRGRCPCKHPFIARSPRVACQTTISWRASSSWWYGHFDIGVKPARELYAAQAKRRPAFSGALCSGIIATTELKRQSVASSSVSWSPTRTVWDNSIVSALNAHERLCKSISSGDDCLLTVNRFLDSPEEIVSIGVAACNCSMRGLVQTNRAEIDFGFGYYCLSRAFPSSVG